ncbi:MAG: D-glycero-beta-D-manno-heptose-7-phosphate kinase [Candidatus Omnitrophica bacterium]|nr:D-glycero-beta-D-manno-heptose-7-phosphate kinase [Candidatus Omnitrophota bacterium]
MNQLLKQFAKTEILVIGDLILDEFIWGSVDRISPEAPVPVVWVDRESVMPGGAANVAGNVQALGGQVRLLGVVGQDACGERLRRELEDRQISSEEILLDPTRPTTTKTRVIAHQQQVVRVDREKTDGVRGTVLKRLLGIAQQAIPQVDGVIIEDYGKGLISPQLLKPVVGLAKRWAKVIAVDPKEEHFSYYRGVTALTPNKKEAALAAKMSITDEKSLLAAGRKILKTLKPEVLLITRGEEGMSLFYRAGNGPVRIPTVAREVFDVSGAGDTVIACFTLARAVGGSFLEAAVLANAAAGVVVGKVGVAACSPEELAEQMFGSTSRKAGPVAAGRRAR